MVAEHHAGFIYGVGAGQIYQEFSSDSDLRANWFLATAQRLQLLKLVAASARFAGLRFYRYEAKQDDAVHAASMQSELAQGRIDQLITFDSPGFVPEFLDSPGYQRTLAKTVEYIPADSIVGHLMFKQGSPQVVASSFFGLVQHSVLTGIPIPRGISPCLKLLP